MEIAKKRSKYNRPQMIMGYLLILPAMILFAVFFIYALGEAFRYSLMDWNGIGEMTNIGLKNYADLLRDRTFWMSFLNNWYYALGIVVFGVIPGLVLAYILSQPYIRGRVIFRTVYFFPRIISAVIYGAVWKWIYDPRRGLLPLILSALGHKGSVALLGNAKTVMLGVTITGGWTYFGFCMVILLAGFMSVDTSLRESALLDGANRFQIFVGVDIPDPAGSQYAFRLYHYRLFQGVRPDPRHDERRPERGFADHDVLHLQAGLPAESLRLRFRRGDSSWVIDDRVYADL